MKFEPKPATPSPSPVEPTRELIENAQKELGAVNKSRRDFYTDGINFTPEITPVFYEKLRATEQAVADLLDYTFSGDDVDVVHELKYGPDDAAYIRSDGIFVAAPSDIQAPVDGVAPKVLNYRDAATFTVEKTTDSGVVISAVKTRDSNMIPNMDKVTGEFKGSQSNGVDEEATASFFDGDLYVRISQTDEPSFEATFNTVTSITVYQSKDGADLSVFKDNKDPSKILFTELENSADVDHVVIVQQGFPERTYETYSLKKTTESSIDKIFQVLQVLKDENGVKRTATANQADRFDESHPKAA